MISAKSCSQDGANQVPSQHITSLDKSFPTNLINRVKDVFSSVINFLKTLAASIKSQLPIVTSVFSLSSHGTSSTEKPIPFSSPQKRAEPTYSLLPEIADFPSSPHETSSAKKPTESLHSVPLAAHLPLSSPQKPTESLASFLEVACSPSSSIEVVNIEDYTDSQDGTAS